MDFNIRQMNLVSGGFKIFALIFLIGGILKALFIGYITLRPGGALSFLRMEFVSEILGDWGLFRERAGVVIQASSQEVLLLILLSIGSGLLIALVLFSAGVLLDFIQEVGIEILDWRRIQFERTTPPREPPPIVESPKTSAPKRTRQL